MSDDTETIMPETHVFRMRLSPQVMAEINEARTSLCRANGEVFTRDEVAEYLMWRGLNG